MLRTSISSLGARQTTQFLSSVRSNITSGGPIRSTAQRSFTTARATSKTQPLRNFTFTFTSHARPTTSPQTILQRLRSSLRSFHSSRVRLDGKPTSPNPTANLGSPGGGVAQAEPTTLSGRLRKLSREYGWSALGVYFLLTALDFPFCYLFVRSMGTDRIGR